MTIENNENCTYISTQLIFSDSNVMSTESVRVGQSYCNILMNNIQGCLLPPGLSTFVSNNILYFKNETQSIKNLRLGFNIVNSTVAIGKSGGFVGSCFTLTGKMRLLITYYNNSTWYEFVDSNSVFYKCDNGNCGSITCPDFETPIITNDKLKPISLQPNGVPGYAVGFKVDFYCENWTGGFGFGGIDFKNNLNNKSKFTVTFLSFE
jgi:hypothetical protein